MTPDPPAWLDRGVELAGEVTHPGSLPHNLALDDALLAAAEAGDFSSCLRFWEWRSTSIVLGASGRLDLEIDREVCLRDGITITRRNSGGGTVLLGRGVLCVSLILPIAIIPKGQAVDRAQREILSWCAAGIARRSGLEIQVQGSGDLTLGGRKFSGSAQRRMKRHVLVHASILYQFPLQLICAYLREPERRPDYRGLRSHEEFVRNLPLSRLDLIAAVQESWSGDQTGPLLVESPRWSERIEQRVDERFGTQSWIERA